MRIGVDLGGTKIEAIALNDQGETLQRRRVNTPRDNYEDILNAITTLVQGLEAELGQEGSVGIGIPGAISPATDLVKNANTTCLIGQPLQLHLSEALGREVRIANDADCFTVSEATDGAAIGAGSVFGVIIGTGCGGGIVINGQLVGGPNAIAGEWGHNPLPWPQELELPGPACYCTKHGCIETWLSGPGLQNDFVRHGGEPWKAQQIVRAAEEGNELAGQALQRHEDRMARALASVINIIDPEVIVLGGGMSNVKRLYDNVPKLWGDYVFSNHVATKLLAPKHGDSSGVRGAAWL
ncbi:MAG: ROK family protein [Pseudomonadota bacterium]